MQALMLQHQSSALRAYYLWGPYLDSDNQTAAHQNSQRFTAPNSFHYWTPTQKFALDLAVTLGLPRGRPAWDVYLVYRKGAIWEQQIPAPLYWQHQLPILQGEPFDVQTLERKIIEALGAARDE